MWKLKATLCFCVESSLLYPDANPDTLSKNNYMSHEQDRLDW